MKNRTNQQWGDDKKGKKRKGGRHNIKHIYSNYQTTVKII